MKLFSQMAALGLLTALSIGSVSCTKKKDEASTAATQDENAPKVFNHFRTSAHKTLDPMKQFDGASAEIITNVYDTLLEYSYLERPYKLQPNLLAEMPTKKADGKTYVFKLRQDVKFIDDEAFAGGKGRALNIDDVIYSIKRFADNNVNSLSYVLIQGFVVGLDEFREETKKAGKATDYSKINVAGLKKVDEHTLEITFTQDNPLALFPFAFSGMSIVAKEAVEKYGEDFAKHPVGTGPFYVKEYSRRGEMVLAKNVNYHQTYPTAGEAGDKDAGLLADAGKKLPLIDEIRLPLIEESQPAMLKFLKGEIDWIGMNKDDFAKMAYRAKDGTFHLNDDYKEKFLMYTEPGLYAGYFAFNMNDKLVGKNKALRQAIAYSLSAANWIELLRNGRGEPLKTIVPHPIAGSERDISVQYYEQNVEMAKKKLAEAGYPEGKGLPELTIEFGSTSKGARQDFEFVRDELAAVGIKLKANFQKFSAYLKKLESNNFQMTSSAWGADYPDAENFLQLLYGPNKTPGPNHSNFANKEYDKLFEEIRFMTNGPERNAKFEKMAAIAKEEVPVVLRWNYLAFGLYQKRVGNMKRNMMVDAPYKYLSLSGGPTKISH